MKEETQIPSDPRMQPHPVHPNQAVADIVVARHEANEATKRLKAQKEAVDLYAVSIGKKYENLNNGDVQGDRLMKEAKLEAEKAKCTRAFCYMLSYEAEAKLAGEKIGVLGQKVR